MWHRHTRIIRIIQKYILKIQELVSFKISHISPAWKISLIGVILILFSLFQPWVTAEESIIQGITPIKNVWSFSALLGYVWFFMFCILSAISFSILSLKRKEKLFFLGMIRIDESFVTLYGAIILCILSIQSFFFISWLQVFSANVMYGKGIIFSFIGIIFLLYGSYLFKKEFRKNVKGSYMSEVVGNKNFELEQQEKSNMKLPF